MCLWHTRSALTAVSGKILLSIFQNRKILKLFQIVNLDFEIAAENEPLSIALGEHRKRIIQIFLVRIDRVFELFSFIVRERHSIESR